MIQNTAITSIVAGAAALLAGCAAPQSGLLPSVPASLRAPEGQVLALAARAHGVQIYECGPGKADPARFEWTFKAPEADLLDSAGRKVGKHYAGPTWESSDQGKVQGEVSARDDGPDANAIPWLLLTAKAASGTGVFGHTRSIQRLRTVGGKAPAGGCGSEQAGQEVRVPYQATYYFYTTRS